MIGADFRDLLAHLDANLQAHAGQDWPGDTGPDRIRQGIFLSRGGHAPGEVCPSQPSELVDLHHYLCEYPDDECVCHVYGGP